MNNDNSTKRILDVLGHAIELARNELEDNPQELIPEPILKPVPKRTGTKLKPILPENKIEKFFHPEFGTIEATRIGNIPYFKALPVLKALGYKNPASIAELFEDKRVILAPKTNGSVDSVTYLSVYDVHNLINRRKVDLLFEFEKWVDDEIVPTLCGKSPAKKKKYPPLKEFTHSEYGKVLAAFSDGETYYRAIDVCKMCGYNRSVTATIENKYSFATNGTSCATNSSFIKADEVRKIFGRKNLDKIPVTRKMMEWLIYDISKQMKAEFTDGNSTIA